MSTIINKVTNTNPLFEVGASVAAELGTSLIEPTGLVGSPNWYGAEPLQSTMYYAFLPVIVGSTISFDRVIEFNIPPSYFESTSHTFRGKTLKYLLILGVEEGLLFL